MTERQTERQRERESTLFVSKHQQSTPYIRAPDSRAQLPSPPPGFSVHGTYGPGYEPYESQAKQTPTFLMENSTYRDFKCCLLLPDHPPGTPGSNTG